MPQSLDSLSVNWASGQTYTGIKFSAVDAGATSSSLLMDLRAGAAGTTSLFSVRKDGQTGARGPTTAPTFAIGTNQNTGIGSAAAVGDRLTTWIAGGIREHWDHPERRMANNTAFGWAASLDASATAADVVLLRDAANTLAQRNGTNAQTFRVYNTFTNDTNFERGKIEWASNVLRIGTEKGSLGGTARALELQTDGTTRVTIPTSGNITSTFPIYVNAGTERTSLGIRVGLTSGAPVVWSSGGDPTILFDTGLERASAGVVRVNNGSTGGGALQLTEMTAPAAPATDNVRIYAEDNGSGKTRLMALFPTGAAVQIAIEP